MPNQQLKKFHCHKYPVFTLTPVKRDPSKQGKEFTEGYLSTWSGKHGGLSYVSFRAILGSFGSQTT